MAERNKIIMTLLNRTPSPEEDSARKAKVPSGTPDGYAVSVHPEDKENEPSSSGKKRYLRQYVMTQPRRSKWAQEYVGVEDTTLDQVNATTREASSDRRRPAYKDKDEERRRRSRSLLVFACVSLIAVLAYPLLKLFTSSMLIKEIEVEGSVPYVTEDLMSAGGIAKGKGLFSVDVRETETKILEKLPYLKTCSVKRIMPDTIQITVTSMEAMIYVSVADEYYALSNDLMVLERSTDPDVFRGRGLIYTDLPDVARSVVGDKLRLSGDTDPDYIQGFLSGVQRSELDGRITRLFLDEKFNIVATVDSIWRVKFGSPGDADMKLLTAARIIDSEDLVTSGGAVIDITVPELACARSEHIFDPDAKE